MKRRVRVLLIAAALGLALPTAGVRPAEAVRFEPILCATSSAGGNDGIPDCLIHQGVKPSVGSVWRPNPSGKPNTWRVRVYDQGERLEYDVLCGPAFPGNVGFTAKRHPSVPSAIVGHCWSRSEP